MTVARKAKKTVPVKVEPEKKLKKVAIVGCSDSKDKAPYDDNDWEVWAMNNAFGHTKRQTRWFEIHSIKFENGKYQRRKLIRPGVFVWSDDFRGQPMIDYMESLAQLDIPVYMQQHWDIIPKSIAFPVEEITKKYGNYFTNSVSYMIALAINEGFGEIGCYGVDMATGSEYGPQRPSCEFFLGIAAGRGIKITLPEEADLLKTRFLYGFQERIQVAWEAKIHGMLEAMAMRENKARNTMDAAAKQVQQYIGAQEGVREVERIWSNLMDTKIWRDPV